MLGVGPGDEVLCQSMTFAASANPIIYQGASPVFVDSEEKTWNMSPEWLEEAIRDRIRQTGRAPKAMIPVDLYGMPASMAEIMEIAGKYGIPVLEDAAEALGPSTGGASAGRSGPMAPSPSTGTRSSPPPVAARCAARTRNPGTGSNFTPPRPGSRLRIMSTRASATITASATCARA